jgi:hypothetical protein
MDFIIALGIFTLVIALSFRMITTNYFFSNKEINIVAADSAKISDLLMTSGIPKNWTNADVVAFGITNDNNLLNTTKLTFFGNLTEFNYSTSKRIIGMKSEFTVYFENKDSELISFSGKSYFGKPNLTLENLSSLGPEDIITVSRFLGYSHDNITEILAMKVITWQQ